MDEGKRKRRRDPSRTEPIRSWSKLYRNSDSWGSGMSDQESSSGQGADDRFDNTISRAVELGYKVIEDQIRQGQKIAEQFASGGLDKSLANGDPAEIGERVLRFYSDIGALWFEMVESLMRNPALGDLYKNIGGKLNGHDQGAATANGANAARANGKAALPVEIISSEATSARVSVDLNAQCDATSLRACPLVATDSGKPPVCEVEITEPVDGWPGTLRITIPAGQPAGNYSGVLLNAVTDEPAGTVCLHIPPQDKTPER